MIKELQERILRHQEYYDKRPDKLAVTPEERVALINEITYLWHIDENPQDLKEEKFMGIPLEVIGIV